MAFIEAYVTNLGKYNEGELASEPLKFPTTTEEVQALLKRIGVDNIQYEEIFIADYDGDLPELNACLGEYESIDELNHLACLLSELDKSDLEKFEAAVASGEHTSGVGDLINLVENLDCYDFYMRKNEKITALYERLSRDDFGKDDDQQRESNSISNQKAMLEDFAARQGFTNTVSYTHLFMLLTPTGDLLILPLGQHNLFVHGHRVTLIACNQFTLFGLFRILCIIRPVTQTLGNGFPLVHTQGNKSCRCHGHLLLSRIMA